MKAAIAWRPRPAWSLPLERRGPRLSADWEQRGPFYAVKEGLMVHRVQGMSTHADIIIENEVLQLWRTEAQVITNRL